MLSPLFIALLAVYWGIEGQALGIVLLMSCAPAAAASYVMAKAMGANAHLRNCGFINGGFNFTATIWHVLYQHGVDLMVKLVFESIQYHIYTSLIL